MKTCTANREKTVSVKERVKSKDSRSRIPISDDISELPVILSFTRLQREGRCRRLK